MPPEQVRGKATPKSDVYALGGVLYYALVGREPEALTSSHPKELRADVSEELDQLIARMTDLDEEARPSPDEILPMIEQVYDKISGGTLSIKERSKILRSTDS